MKFTTFLLDGQPRLGLLDGNQVIDLNAAQPQVPADLRAALAQGIDLAAAARAALGSAAPRRALAELTLAPLLPEPGKTVCLGLNYFDHAKEGGREKPEYPWLFLRGKSSLIGHGAPGVRPKVSERFDYEAELAVVIGSRVPRHVSQDAALSHVFGYSVFNDMSVRDYQKRTPQWSIGKNFDATGAFGPVLVSADALPAGAAGLRIQSRLNGQVMQDANTADMIWSVAETIALLSECMTLEPGDVLVMGTPAGVGQARTPPVWMKPGDTIEIEIEGIGTLVNPIRAEA
ncbi:2-keto-4-pentenoate hydratase/2-oxohepta-3-ene-1,7-dioic acid hydratase [Sphaerotilus natans subsp. natans DSM 6575]|uniref:2-keto-4-pentenoate hydratase/2-oxohepta-3-ene-1,7-dioic acid hydratase n=1 Tax=Sphaerotilus natans subsp. natans DSM 6575 TaxID=1286631 RepID=A0A059KGY6_9BURK|nr:fumarylacetoacetate hydrolase family protein [Sphaerotilus natans]KDB50716.1 2-keto-4-pentenoate hydratase/2-oxohepta-3-ene-1,7-dioic acid hydratase [Sphaerotilus natans subsp. natans DSM 6575]SIS02614.1 2-keto-4-pentenoate hydratase/2-oxohepta-3-ene-1,7-dioic acid hydratase (catechol pathway) [Sphaerotilus natans]